MHLEHAEAERASGLPRQHRHDLVLARLEHVGGLQEDALPYGRRRAGPLGESFGGRLDRPLRVRPARARDVGDDVAAPRVAVLERAAALGLDERASDEEPRVDAGLGLGAHAWSPFTPRARPDRPAPVGVDRRSVPFVKTLV